MSYLAASIMVQTLEQGLAHAARAAELGATIVEYRIDLCTESPDAVRELVERSPLPCIVTCRPIWEGGQYDGDDQYRISLLEHACLGTRQPAYLDIELAAYQRSANLRQKVGLVVDHADQPRPVSTGLILSTHDFETRPADLLQRYEAISQAPAARVAKLAWRARSLRDNLECFELLLNKTKPTIALAMGEYGLPSRVLAKKFGGLLTFAALDSVSTTAPGQPTLQDIKQLYRWDKLDAQTKVFGVIGYPVSHSMSPAIHNAGFEQSGFNGVYLPMPIPPEYEHFKATVGAWLDFAPLHFRGASVTIPHKENLLRFVQERGGEIEPLAQRIGAANTLIVREDGSLYARNTDYQAALASVCSGMGIARSELQGLRVAVIGAGGAARAIVAGFASHGSTVVIYNRTLEKAKGLLEDFRDEPGKIIAMPNDKICDTCATVFINCTPVGMYPNTDQTPIIRSELTRPGRRNKGWGPGTVVFDTIYNPLETRLLREAREAGCLTISGLEMFVRQAAVQFESWTGHDAPMELFREVVRERLDA